MFTDWLIWLDYLEENNQNTTFLRLITPITFGIIECHYYYYNYSYSSGDGLGDGDGFGNGNGFGDSSGSGNGYSDGYGNGCSNGYGFIYNYSNSYNEEH